MLSSIVFLLRLSVGREREEVVELLLDGRVRLCLARLPPPHGARIQPEPVGELTSGHAQRG